MTLSAAPIHQARHHMYEALILDTAEALFARVGVDQCQVKEVAGSAGISLATQYKYFRSKDALLRAVHARRLARLMERIAQAVRPQTTPLEEMLHAGETYMRFHMEHPHYLGMHLREGNAWFEKDRLRFPEQVEALERGIEWASSSFEAGVREGLFIDDPPRLMALAAIAANQVHLSHWVAQGMTEKQDAVIRRAHAHFIRAFCRVEHVPALLDDLSSP